MTINQVKCDGCGKVEDNSKSFIPKNWYHMLKKDLCPDCTKKVEEFIQSLKKYIYG